MSDALIADGLRHHRARRFDLARASYDAVLARDPRHADARHLLGLAAHSQGAHGDAIAHLKAAVALRPDVAHFHANLGTARLAAGDHAGAEQDFRAALALDDRNDDAWTNLGLTLMRQDRGADAEPCFVAARTLAPGRADAGVNLADCLRRRGDASPDIAEACYRAALDVCPDHAPSLTNLGALLTQAGRPDEAEYLSRRALARRPDSADAHHNLAAALAAGGKLTEATVAVEAALAIAPDHADAHFLRGTLRLLEGDFSGFSGLEYRWRRRGFAAPRGFIQPRWDGRDLAGRTLLLHAEQGLGDAIQMLRFVPALAAAGRVVLEVPGSLRRLADDLGATVVTSGEAPPPFDVECPLPSLPLALGARLATLPACVPYLRADPTLEALWRHRLAGLQGLKAGLCWAGNPGYVADSRRSIPPERLAVLKDTPGVTWVSLQLAASPPFAMHDWTGELRDFSDTAALAAALDVVVTVDTSVAHLAGALGKPVRLLNRFDTCWRWLWGRDDSPWYPTMRIFRQPRPGDWGGVLATVREDLAAYARDARKLAM
jgi:tetratricopeptide (TPR) repeat protein